jgi:3-hydroxyisobutyrate dehydrogenase-like beta-hydroxyacid dehydrogenase
MEQRIGLIGTGEMGSGVGGWLVKHGAVVVTSLEGRSAASAARIASAGVTVVDGMAEIANTCAITLSIVPPDRALGVAGAFVAAYTPRAASPLFVDCNAIAPGTAETIGGVITAGGVRFLDAGIIGTAPSDGYDGPKIYASGPDVAEFEHLNAFGLQVKPMPGGIGVASALKMSYAGISKGVTGIGEAMFASAERAGVHDALMAELASSQSAIYAFLLRQLPKMPAKAYRWVAEMREIGTFASATPGAEPMYEGLAQLYAAIAAERSAKGPAEDR